MSKEGDEESEIKLPASEDEKFPDTTKVGPFMCSLFEKQLFTDVTFSSKDNKAFISAHRAVLAAKCDFFENLLFGDQKEEAVGMTMHVEISNVPFSVFRNIVRYFYTDEVEFTDDYTVLEVYAAAESFHIQNLIDLCNIYIESIEITESNACSLFHVCNTKNVEGLKSRCISYIQKNTFQVISSTDFEKCSFTTIREICGSETLNLSSEVELLEAVLRWVNLQPNHTKKELTRSLIKCVRFLSFTPKEFSVVIQRHADLLTPEEGLKILMYLNNSTPEILKALPKWCNKSLRSFQVDKKNIQKDLLQECSKGGKIRILLKPTKTKRDITELTSVLLMKCIKGMHQIKSIKFSFEDIKNDGSLLVDLVIKTYVNPDGISFLRKHSVNSSESSFVFSMGVTVSKGQKVKFEITAKINQSGKFLQFQTLYNDPYWHFSSWLSSKSKLGHLNFISEVEYEPLAPRLSSSEDKT